ncbi:restriction endonuclease subunit S [Mycoplasma capricolum]|uniref:restriction endonuclease subunit S n=1 Tax=Mycoplasma capricolum TaxID=2095 RepID=UPI003DA4DAE4
MYFLVYIDFNKAKNNLKLTNTWEQEKLGDLIDKGRAGGTPSTSNKDYYNGTIPFLSISDLTKSDGYIFSTEKTITKKGLDSSSTWIVPYGSLTLSIYATIGKVGFLCKELATSQAFYSMIINDNITKNFIFHFLRKSDFKNEWFKLLSTGTQANLNSEKVKNFVITLPINKNEQSKISSLFSNLDSLITLHQWECNFWKFRNFVFDFLKFSTRFFKKIQKYTHTWEQEKLGNLTILNRFPQISANQLKKINEYKGDIYLLPSSNNNDWKCRYNEKISHLINNAEIITVGRARNPNPKYVNGRFISSQNHIIESKMNDILTNKFLYFFICKVGRTFYSAASTYPMFTRVDFGDARLLFPLINEQHKILKTFNSLDSLITLHQWECNFWKFRNFVFDFLKFSTRFFKKIQKYTHTWEQEKLGNLTILNRFPQISANQLKKINEYKGDIYLLPSSNNNDWKCRYNEKISHLINNAEIITVGRARNPNPKYVNGRFISSQNHIIESKMNDILTNKFLYFFICKVGRTFYSAASTYPMFTRVDFGDARLLFPLINEQHKILKTFNSLDSLITLHQRGYKWRENKWKKTIYCYTNIFKIE